MISFWPLAPGLLLAGFSSLCGAQATDEVLGGWRITPRLSVGATYSDNIRLAPADEAEGDWVWQVDPGISIRKQGGRLDLRLDYTAQGLMYNQNSDANTINNILQTFGTAELYQDHLFLDAYASISQVPVTSRGRVDAGGLGASSGAGFIQSLFGNLNLGLPGAQDLFNPIGLFSNLALTGNQTTSNNFGVSPYWQQNFGGWAQMLLRYRYDEVRYSGQQESGDLPDVAVETLDSQTNTIEFNLTNGHRFSLLTWNLDYFYQRQDQDQAENEDSTDGNEDRRERVAGQLNYRLNSQWALRADAGYENNELSTYEDNQNGGYGGLGAVWTPSRFITLSGLYGWNINEVAVQWNPSARTNLRVSRRDQAVGESPGVRWEGALNHRSRYGIWSASYTEEVTNTQQLSSGGVSGGIPDGQQPPPGSSGPFGLSDQDFLRKRFDAGVTYQRGRNNLGFGAFHESREFQDAANDETAYGAGVLWTWRFAPRTASFLGTGWEFDEPGDEQRNDYWVSVIGLARVFTANSGGLISYRYYRNDADPSDQSFRENRLNVRFNLRF